MITSLDILDKTGIKSAKTLTRWHQRGLIPEPMVRTHPSGRGKVAYWPDWVLDRCLKIVELQRQGHSLQSAALVLAGERFRDNEERVAREPNVSDLLAAHQVKHTPERDGTLLEALLFALLASVKHRVTDDGERAALFLKLKERDAVGLTLNLWRAGYNPVLVYDGEQVDIVPDFVVGWRLSEGHPPQTAFVVAPLLPTLLKAMPKLERFVGTLPTAWPAPKVWMQHGDAIVEYAYAPAGPLGFELIRETARVVNNELSIVNAVADAVDDVPSEAGSDADANSDVEQPEHV